MAGLRSPASRPAFLSSARPPPTPTLFPYTTLFRSLGEAAFEAHLLHRGGGGLGDDGAHVRVQVRVRADRKSTRLNSSHVSISYAVFCLKKKNTLQYLERALSVKRDLAAHR